MQAPDFDALTLAIRDALREWQREHGQGQGQGQGPRGRGRGMNARARGMPAGARGARGAPGGDGAAKQQEEEQQQEQEQHELLREMLTPLIARTWVRVQFEDIVEAVLAPGQPPELGCLKKLRVGPRVGGGAFGQVFQLDARRAVKIQPLTPRGARGNGDPRADFEAEARLARKAARAGVGPEVHSHYACCTAYGRCYGVLVMELVRGEQLGAWLQRAHPGRTLATVRQRLRAAIERLHRHGVHHNDLHAGNILVTAANQVRVIDYGLAKDVGDDRPGGRGGGEGGRREHWDFNVLRAFDNDLPAMRVAPRSGQELPPALVDFVLRRVVLPRG